jgi:hypothetical protein
MPKWVHKMRCGASFDMLIYEHSISGKKHPGHDQCSHANIPRFLVSGSYLSSKSEQTGIGPLPGPGPVRGGSMLVFGTGITLRTVKKLAEGRVYCTSSIDELSMKKNFGGA